MKTVISSAKKTLDCVLLPFLDQMRKLMKPERVFKFNTRLEYFFILVDNGDFETIRKDKKMLEAVLQALEHIKQSPRVKEEARNSFHGESQFQQVMLLENLLRRERKTIENKTLKEASKEIRFFFGIK